MFSLTVIGLSLFIYGSNVYAAEGDPEVTPSTVEEVKPIASLGKVVQIFRDKKLIVIDLSTNTAVDQLRSAVVTMPSGEACEGKVVQAQDRKMLIDLISCSSFDQIKAGVEATRPLFTTIESPPTEIPMLMPVAPVESSPPAAERARVRIFIGLGHNSGDKLKYESSKLTDGTTPAKGTSEFTIETAAHLALGVIYAPAHKWGFVGNISFEAERKLKSLKFTEDWGGTASASLSAEKPTVRFTIIEWNALYRWNQLYLPFGFNYTIARFKQADDITGNIESTGGLGLQFGIGLFATEQMRLEILSQTIANHLKMSSGTDVADFGTGYMSGVTLRLAMSL